MGVSAERLGRVGVTTGYECRKAKRTHQINLMSIEFAYGKLTGKVRNGESCDQSYVQTVKIAS